MQTNIRFFSPIIAVVVITFLCTGWLNYINSKILLEKSILENQNLFAQEVSANINATVGTIEETARILTQFSAIHEVVDAQNADIPAVNTAKDFFDTVMAQHRDIADIVILDRTGRIFSPKATLYTKPDDSKYYQRLWEGQPQFTVTKSKVTGMAILYYTAPVVINGTPMGGVRIAFDLQGINEDLIKLLPPEQSYRIRVVDSAGNIFLCSCPQVHPMLNIKGTTAEQILSQEPSTLYRFTDDTDSLGTYLPVENSEWAIIISGDTEDVMAPAATLLWRTILICVVGALAILLSTFFLLQKLTTKIRKLEEANRQSLQESKNQLELLVEKRTRELHVQKEQLAKEQTLHNGQGLSLETVKLPYTNSWGALAGLLGISRDSTQRKRTENELEEARLAGIECVPTKPVAPSSLHDTLPRLPQMMQSNKTTVLLGTSSPKAPIGAQQVPIDYADASVQSPEVVEEHELEHQPPPMTELQGKRVLVAEDNEINQLIAREILMSFGVAVTIANNGLEAVQWAGSSNFDAILMDIQMPEMDGMEATRRIRTNPKLAMIPIIAMTAHAMTGEYEKSLLAGMQAHITKPISPVGLYSTLVRWIEQKA